MTDRRDKDKEGNLLVCTSCMMKNKEGATVFSSTVNPIAGCGVHEGPCLKGRDGKDHYFAHPGEPGWEAAVAAHMNKEKQKADRKTAMAAAPAAVAAPKAAAAAAAAAAAPAAAGPLWRQPAPAPKAPAPARAAAPKAASNAANWRNPGVAPKKVFAAPPAAPVAAPQGFYPQRREGKLFPLGKEGDEYEPTWGDYEYNLEHPRRRTKVKAKSAPSARRSRSRHSSRSRSRSRRAKSASAGRQTRRR